MAAEDNDDYYVKNKREQWEKEGNRMNTNFIFSFDNALF